jgi:type VI secretion system secreted protein VgrG
MGLMPITLSNRAVQLTTPLGKDALLPQRIDISERLGQPFQWVLDLVSESGDLAADDILGKEVTLSFQLPSGGATRAFHGHVTEFAQSGYVRRLHEYRAIVRPWLWFLSRTSDCRIFQKKTIPAIFEQIVKDYGFNDYRLKLSGSYKPWDYCVQYRETDFNFVSRLLEHEGIHYFFEHHNGRHVMVLCDDSTTLGTVSGYEEIPFYPPDASLGQSPRDHFDDWSVTRAVVPGAYSTTDYDFTAPRKSLKSRADTVRSYARSDFEIFDFPAEVPELDGSETKRIAKLRLEELQTAYLTARGRGDAAGVMPGTRFKLTEHPRQDFNREYLVTAASYVFHTDAVDAGSAEGGAEFSVSIEAVEAATPIRPPRTTPKPVVQGTQTAIVVGKSGEEIDTDQHGRVKVQFPWDRRGKNDENSSCWVRVAQVWAGKNWGAIHIPRIGQEVLVSFLEGDPDRPIVTGRVYNGESTPPYDLPANATQSGIKSRSSKGGSGANFNEIRFEDKMGEEELSFHAEKDLKTVVEHDQTISVGNDETVDITHDRKSTIGNNETLSVAKDQSTSIGNNETRAITNNRTTNVGKDEQLTVGNNQTSSVSQSYKLTAGQDITFETGSSKLVMKSDGTIELSGMTITIEGSQAITLKSGQKIELNGMQLKLSGTTVDVQGTSTSVKGTMLDLQASAIASLKGSLTQIG